ncbi:non-ribosomal peptide synthetase [Nonomuraea soli]|uniref:Amino acid adenylation domain-containing protein n=1 Tax=Nonomuraea soli TaxID=1032476 RepID=A0A7W0HTQ9_9ACTN|nr:non-ribosomal peptide synthetase [Nonomuraea soli]MBA2895403.1 amino acid adenylation domain-containing protein [Nonomuraea soli]
MDQMESTIEAVIRLLAEALPGDAELAPDSSLRENGLDSISAVRVWFDIQREFSLDLPVERLGECTTPADLAARIDEVRGTAQQGSTAEPAGPVIEADPGARFEPFPLTPVQQSYVLGKDEDFSADAVGCQVYREFEVDGLDAGRLRSAWQRVVEHHDALRLVVGEDGTQRVLEQAPEWELPVHDGDGEQVRVRLSRHVSPVGAWPPFAIEVSGRTTVHFSIDASVTDGRGLDVLLRDWWRCYHDPEHEPAAPAVSLRDCVLALDGYRGNPGDLDYWRKRLADLPQGPAMHSDEAGERVAMTAELTSQEWSSLRGIAAGLEVSPTSLALTLFAEALQRVEGRAFPIALTTTGRAWLPREVDEVVGPFTSTAVFAADDTAGEPLSEAARAVHHALWSDLGHAGVPGVTVMRELRSGVSLPVVFTSLLDARPDETVPPVTYALSQTSGVALDHQMWEYGGALQLRWDVTPGRFAPGVLESVFAAFVNSLRALAADGDAVERPLNELQQAYFVARAGGSHEFDGCQVYHSFHVRDLDVDRLSQAWMRMVHAYDALRSEVTHDGRLRVRPGAPRTWTIPVADHVSVEEMAGRAFPLGRWPQWELRAEGDTVHIAIDLTVLDGMSIHRVLRELFRLYDDPSAAVGEPLPPDEHVAERHDGYWSERFGDMPPGPPLDCTPSRRTRLRGSLAEWDRVEAAAREQGVTPDALVLAALTDALSARFTDPFTVSVVRWTEESQPYRPGEFTALSWVTHTADDAAGAYHRQISADAEHGTLAGLAALRKIIMKERRRRSYAFPVVYTSILDLTDHTLPEGVEAGPWMTYTPDVALDCIVVREGDRLAYYWDVAESAFAEGEPAELFDAFERALRGEKRQAADRDTMLYAWNDTARDFPDTRPVHLLFEEQARNNPDAIALRHREGTMTYGELNSRANAIAWRLKSLDVGPGTIVGIRLCRGFDMVAAVFGILKAGGAYLPLEPSLPPERARVMMADAGADILLTCPRTPGWPVPEQVRAVELDDELRDDRGDPEPVNSPDDLAYVIFTSGSTGKPKGVEVTHRPVLNLLNWCYRTFGFGPSDVGLCVTSLGFDLSVFDILGLLGCGAGLYIADEGQQRDPDLLLDALLDEPITFWNSAPTTLNQLAQLFPERAGRPGTGDLRLVFLSGDYTPLPLPDAVRGLFPNASIVSLGGATEATVWSNYFEVGAVDPAWRSIPYGRPIDNSRYYILDEDQQPCPVGTEGDLHIAGQCLSLGYRNQPELTAERFVADPFAREPGQRMYRTGDRAAYLPDGTIIFLGRADAQVKIRGFRVELGEIEHRLRLHPGVRDVVVVARDDEAGERKLVAYVIAESGRAPSVAELRGHAAETLPDYMVPNYVAFLTTFPATDNGKLDRDALPWPVNGESPAEAAPAAPADELVREISAMFAGLLDGGEVDPAQDLWDQGATSFTMVQVSKALQKSRGTRIAVSALLENPTVNGIARTVAAQLPAGAPAPQPATPAPAEPAPAEDAPAEVEFFSPEDRAAFKEGAWNLRRAGAEAIRLETLDVAQEHYTWRSSIREFGQGPVPRHALSRLLGLLRERRIDGEERHLYPSAGDTYAVQAYLHVAKDGVDGLAEGVYYYHPREHALQLVNDRPDIDRTVHFSYNRPTYDRAAFSLYLVGQLKGIEPLYGEQSLKYLTLEAGYLGQLLMTGQAASGLGLCPIGDIAFDRLRDQLDLDDGHRFLQAFLGGPASHPKRASSTGEAPVYSRPDDIAVIGLAGRYPGADDLDAFWRNLSSGTSAIGSSPRGPVPGGYLEHIDRFDSLLFHIAPQEAAQLDPQLRLLLHSVWECLENAGHTAESLRRAAPRVGVFVGSMWQDYQHAGAAAWKEGGQALVSATSSDAANRISYFFDFTGPSIAVDTSCSSALTALHLAAESLRKGECDAAVVGGVSLVADPYHASLLDGLDLLTDDPAGRAFDDDHPGWTVGEGVGALLLRPAEDAGRDRDVVHGIIEGTWIAHAGHSSRFTAPSAEAMAASMRQTLERAGTTPGDVSYVECAAAGATLADAAELEALTQVFDGRPRPVAVGTVKPNIGHLEAASGLSQLTKVLLQMRHGQIAPTLAAGHPVDGGPVQVADRLGSWEGEPRRALINAFGATGTHGHALLRAAAPREPSRPDGRQHAVVLSAAGHEQLSTLARRMLDHLTDTDDSLADIAFTTQTGRVALPYRIAVTCSDLRGLREGLEAFLAGERQPGVVEAPGAAADPGSEAEAADAWMAGQDVPWEKYWTTPAARVQLPTYPFAAQPYWISQDGPATAAPRPVDDLEDYLKETYAEVSGIPAAQLNVRVPLEQYGLTSNIVAQLNARLERDLGERSRTLFFEHRDLAGVAAALGRGERAQAPAVSRPADDDAIAIIGIAGRYPQAPDLAAFWENLAAGRDSVTRIPQERARDGWPVDRMWGGFLDDVDRFDPLLFGITPRDAALMDPQERLFLEVAWEALEDAGYPRARLRGSDVAVYAGVMYNEYPFFGVEQTLMGSPQDTGATTGGVANRVSYHLDLTGPSMTVDTMCSSSLTALHLAVRSLRYGECGLALVGGINLSLHPNKFIQHSRMKLTATDRVCRSFGAGGDGFVPGEGAGVVLLKPLSRAEADGDRIHAVIRGTSVLHSGKTNGWVVPNPAAEGELVRRAIADAGVDPASIGYVECHGAGTELGDPIEVNAMLRVFGDAPLGSIPIGSVKSNIGHVEAGAGIAGLTKIVLQMRHGKLVPSLHAEELNPNIDWDRVPFRVQRELADWPGGPRRACISSFGAGGTIAHAVLEEYTSGPAPRTGSGGPQLAVLSAYDEERLRASAARLAAHLRRTGGATDTEGLLRELRRVASGQAGTEMTGDALAAHLVRTFDEGAGPRLADVAYTLQAGREPLRERLAVVVTGVPELCDRLERFAGGDDAGVLRGRATASDQREPEGADLQAIGRHWVSGGHVDWERLHGGASRVIELPTYPFARMRCWVPEPSGTPVRQEPSGTPARQEPSGTPARQEPSGTPARQEPETPEPRRETPLYEKVWVAAEEPQAREITGKVLCLFTPGTEDLARELAGAIGPDRVTLSSEPGADLPFEPSGWIDLCDLDQVGTAHETARLALLQRALRGRTDLRVLHVTSGLLDLEGPPPSLGGARQASFVRMLSAEYSNVTATVVDTDRPTAAQLLAEWGATDAYTEICYRDGRRHRPRLQEVAAPHTELRPDPEAVYLVTGGTRGLGALVARHLVERGARKLALIGARPLPPREQWNRPGLPDAARETIDVIRGLEGGGARVLVHTGPLTERSDIAAFLDKARTSLGPIGGVVHCAGRSSQGRPSLVHKDLADIQQVMAPKAGGLEVLAELCSQDRPAFFLAFSSICAVVPRLASGVADYAAANTFVDLFTGYQRRSGRPEFRSVDWPQWQESGGARGEPNVCAPVGVATLGDDEGLRILERVLALPGGASILPCPAEDGSVDVEALLLPSRATSTRPSEPVRQERDWLAPLFSEMLGIPLESLDPTAEFGELGVESVMLAELVKGIEGRLGRHLEPSVLLDYPTLDQLREHLGETVEPVEPVETPEAVEPVEPVETPEAVEAAGPAATAGVVERVAPTASAPPDAEGKIAIIGMACRLPGAPDLDTFWDNLTSGRCAVGEVPESRWDHRELYHPEPRLGRSISKWGGFVDDIEGFDAGFFAMTEQEARALDPAIRMFLECCATALSDAGYDPAELRGSDVGVFAGARMSGYGRRAGVRAGGLASDQNFIAARVAHHFDFHGPNLVVDSACSSSLVSVQLAGRSLLAGESRLALAGGVEVLLDEEDYLQLSAAKALSPTGRCHTFDESADGFVPGEGCGVVLLKPLAAALADGDRIHAVIEAVAVNNDGHTMGITTPNPEAQADVVRRALAAAGRSAAEIGLVEAHGTGTLIGDPIELRALTQVFRESTDAKGATAIGSVKSNIGHTLSAAGIAGLLKAALAVEHGRIPPTLSCERPNPRFDFDASPFRPSTEPRDWADAGKVRVAGVSSFGLGGTNAHLVLSQLDPELREGAPAQRRPLPAPVFNRRRLWLDKEPAGQPAKDNEPARRMTSILDLDLTMNGERVRGSA